MRAQSYAFALQAGGKIGELLCLLPNLPQTFQTITFHIAPNNRPQFEAAEPAASLSLHACKRPSPRVAPAGRVSIDPVPLDSPLRAAYRLRSFAGIQPDVTGYGSLVMWAGTA